MASSIGKLALYDEPARQVFAPILLPRSAKRTITSTVSGIQERLHGLAEYIPRDGETELLETAPAEVL